MLPQARWCLNAPKSNSGQSIYPLPPVHRFSLAIPSTSSPRKATLNAVDAKTGKVHWKLKLGVEERNSVRSFADGKLYVPMLDDPATKADTGEAGTTGAFYVIKPGATNPKSSATSHWMAAVFGTPAAYNGKVYLQTTRHLYCFGKKGNNPRPAAEPAPEQWPAPGPAKSLEIVPSEVLLRPGQTASFRVRTLDPNGFVACIDLKSSRPQMGDSSFRRPPR